MTDYQLYLDGAWQGSDRSFPVRDPGNGEEFARVALAGVEEARTAIASAYSALPHWRGLTGLARADYLLALADRLASAGEEIATAITRENGKPLAQSKGEVGVAIDHLRWFAEEARRVYGRIVPNQVPGKRHFVIRQPVGVVAAIAPWNFPLVLALRKAAPALAAGCPVIVRPAGQTPVSMLLFARIAESVGIPKGVFQVIAGPARDIVAEFMANPNVAKVTFTGSTEVGKQLLAQSAQTVTKLSLELGGHAPVVVFDDADLDAAVEAALITKFRNTGQSCIAGNRLYVQRTIHDEFLKRFTAKTAALRVGYGLEDGVDIGPLVNRAALDTAQAHIADAVNRGARIETGGAALDRSDGAYLQPTVLSNVAPDSICMVEETFAPVAPVVAFDTEAQAIAWANDSRYGLAAYVYTDNLSRALRVGEAIEAGTVGINDAVPSTSIAPFGGMKASGLGRELGSEGIDAFLETKHLSIGGID